MSTSFALADFTQDDILTLQSIAEEKKSELEDDFYQFIIDLDTDTYVDIELSYEQAVELRNFLSESGDIALSNKVLLALTSAALAYSEPRDRIVVIGGGVAALKSALALSHQFCDYEIIILNKGPTLRAGNTLEKVPGRGTMFHYTDRDTIEALTKATVQMWEEFPDSKFTHEHTKTHYVITQMLDDLGSSFNAIKDFYVNGPLSEKPDIGRRFGDEESFLNIEEYPSLRVKKTRSGLSADAPKEIQLVAKTNEGMFNTPAIMAELERRLRERPNVSVFVNTEVVDVSHDGLVQITCANGTKIEAAYCTVAAWDKTESILDQSLVQYLPTVTKRAKMLVKIRVDADWADSVNLPSLFEGMGAGGFMIAHPGKTALFMNEKTGKKEYEIFGTFSDWTNIFWHSETEHPLWLDDLITKGEVSAEHRSDVPEWVQSVDREEIAMQIYDGICSKMERFADQVALLKRTDPDFKPDPDFTVFGPGFRANSSLHENRIGVVITPGKIAPGADSLQAALNGKKLQARDKQGFFPLMTNVSVALALKGPYAWPNAEEVVKHARAELVNHKGFSPSKPQRGCVRSEMCIVDAPTPPDEGTSSQPSDVATPEEEGARPKSRARRQLLSPDSGQGGSPVSDDGSVSSPHAFGKSPSELFYSGNGGPKGDGALVIIAPIATRSPRAGESKRAGPENVSTRPAKKHREKKSELFVPVESSPLPGVSDMDMDPSQISTCHQ